MDYIGLYCPQGRKESDTMDYKREAIVGLRPLSTSFPTITHNYWISYLNSTSLGWAWIKKYDFIYFF